jgi:TonB family protein
VSSGDVPLEFAPHPKESKILFAAAGVAFLLESVVLISVGLQQAWLSKPPAKQLDASQFIEAQMIQAPEEPHLKDEKKIAAPAPKEVALSKKVDQGRVAKPNENPLQDQNQTQGGPALGPTHGPVATFNPAPTIPSYLQNQLLQASVVIDFFVTASGVTTPKLVGSSGNEELDALAIATAKRWQFKPGEKDSKPVDAKVRLRINFKVE